MMRVKIFMAMGLRKRVVGSQPKIIGEKARAKMTVKHEMLRTPCALVEEDRRRDRPGPASIGIASV